MVSVLLASCGSLPAETPVPARMSASSLNRPVLAQGLRPGTLLVDRGVRPPADFNGDGYRDLAVSKWETFGTAGLVQVIYGSSAGLTAAASQQWSPADFGVSSEQFGHALVNGDFDADGFSDLAVGAPAWRPERGQGGEVLVIYGEVVPTLVEVEVAVPRLRPTRW